MSLILIIGIAAIATAQSLDGKDPETIRTSLVVEMPKLGEDISSETSPSTAEPMEEQPAPDAPAPSTFWSSFSDWVFSLFGKQADSALAQKRSPDACGMAAEKSDIPFQRDTFISIRFPQDMVTDNQIDELAIPSPFIIRPALDAQFTWVTSSSGDLYITGEVCPEQTYEIFLRSDLTTKNGEPFDGAAWGITYTSAPLEVNNAELTSEKISAHPQVAVEFNYPVALDSAAAGAYFKNRLTHEHYASEVIIPSSYNEENNKEKPQAASFLRFRPIEPLPVNASYDFVVESVVSAAGARTLHSPHVVPVGTTKPMNLLYVEACNRGLDRPNLAVKFDTTLAETPIPPDSISVSPAVPNLRLRRVESFIIAEGDFQIGNRYTVTVAPKVLGIFGYSIDKTEQWGATFKPKPPEVLFPERQIRQRTKNGMRFSFYQINTGELRWQLSPIPEKKMSEAYRRIKEFDNFVLDKNDNPVWAANGQYARKATEFLTDALALSPVAEGKIAAHLSPTPELRDIVWAGESGKPLSGAMLLEVRGEGLEGTTIGNRAIIYFGELAITRKTSPQATWLRVANLADGSPVANAQATLLDEKFQPIKTLKTDDYGTVEFPAALAAQSEMALVEHEGRKIYQPFSLSDRFAQNYYSDSVSARWRGYTFTDRPLYRPSQKLYFKGIVRDSATIAPPSNRTVDWQISLDYSGKPLVSGQATTNDLGGWNSEWDIPADVAIGQYRIEARIEKSLILGDTNFDIEEFRQPPFSVECQTLAPSKHGESRVSISSHYFHGSPNAGAKVSWKATWYEDYYPDDDLGIQGDAFSANSEDFASKEVEGEGILTPEGTLEISCPWPFAKQTAFSSAHVSWDISILGPDGQSIPGGADQYVANTPVILALQSVNGNRNAITYKWLAKEIFDNLDNSKKAPTEATIELYRATTTSVKEKIARNVYRYRNSTQNEIISTLEKIPPGPFTFKPKAPGHYIVRVVPPKNSDANPVSTSVYFDAPGEADLPIEGDQIANIVAVDAQRTTRTTPWLVGETAELRITAPTAGVAWVTVETDKILDTYTVLLEGNLARIPLLIKPEYEPNVFVSVYILRPGLDSKTTGEMFASTRLEVEAPARRLDMVLSLDKKIYEPRQTIAGQIAVSCHAQPVAAAELTIYAVDDAILALDKWELPKNFFSRFFAQRGHGMTTYTALKAYIDSIPREYLTAKGFVVGGGWDSAPNNTVFTRKDFLPLILWQPSVRTNAEGIATFECPAPDNLTRFRFIAIAHTGNNSFGATDATIEVTRSLIIEPALPRFIRIGDSVELRAVIRSKNDDTLAVTCQASSSLEGGGETSVSVKAGIPSVVTFPARATALGEAKVTFAVKGAKDADTVEISLPTLDRATIFSDTAVLPNKGNEFTPATATLPPAWAGKTGTYSLTISTTPYFDKILGLPTLIAYPYGCLEQKSSRLLALLEASSLHDNFPDAALRKENFTPAITGTLEDFSKALLPGGFLPYWQGGKIPNLHVTIQATWCAASASVAGYSVPENLVASLRSATYNILDNRTNRTTATPPSLRAFALFVLSRIGTTNDEAPLAAAANDLYLQRDRLDLDGKAWLALAMQRLNILPQERDSLVASLTDTAIQGDFNPRTFSSPMRTEALCLWAQGTTEANQTRLEEMMRNALSLSTQENAWTLAAFQAINQKSQKTQNTPLERALLNPEPAALSPNGCTATWEPRPLDTLATAKFQGVGEKTIAVLTATYPLADKDSLARGMTLDRVVKNLTAPTRDGSPKNPFAIGDQLLISYRWKCEKSQNYLAIEDALPAALEIVNPNLALFAQVYNIPIEKNQAYLSHSELRDDRACLFFDFVPAGASSYSILARVTSAGDFAWPSAKAAPMYDARTAAHTTLTRIISK